MNSLDVICELVYRGGGKTAHRTFEGGIFLLLARMCILDMPLQGRLKGIGVVTQVTLVEPYAHVRVGLLTLQSLTRIEVMGHMFYTLVFLQLV